MKSAPTTTPDLEVEGIVINQFQARASLPQQIINELRDEGLPVLASFLSSSVKIKESHQQAKPMIHLDRSHKLALEFGALFDEIEPAACRGAEDLCRAKAAAKRNKLRA
jgi:chromosome partitioning protein